ncbi:MAG: 3-deoxy-7-phosphoheptulonate synthase [Planctomycetes bacterium]|nr:3-deoxy-7-phosphoheptulonate synthase [Planctomycetota bacterium]
MIIVLRKDASEAQVAAVERRVYESGGQSRRVTGDERTLLVVLGEPRLSREEMLPLPGVLDALRVSKPYKLASIEARPRSPVTVGRTTFGAAAIACIAGPCAVENRRMFLDTAARLASLGVTMIRGGAYKPRSSPYAFQGLGEAGLEILAEARERHGLAVVTEVMAPGKVALVARHADVLQIGARNMQNYDLLKACAEVQRPVLLKRGPAATLDEWLMSAEYLLAGGNNQVLLCERGIRTFETSTRNPLDLNALPALRRLTHLPVLVDPSHGTGARDFVTPMALAAVAAGADGLLVEVHPDPEQALSDGAQSLTFDQFERLLRSVRAVAAVVGRELFLAAPPQPEALQPAPARRLGARSPARTAYSGAPGAGGGE